LILNESYLKKKKTKDFSDKNTSLDSLFSKNEKDLLSFVKKSNFYDEKVIKESIFVNNSTNLNLKVSEKGYHKDAISSCCLSKDNSTLYTSSIDSTSKIYSIDKKSQKRRINEMGDDFLSSLCLIEKNDTSILVCSSFDDNIYVYSNDYGKVLEVLKSHTDSVTRLSFMDDKLISSSHDTTVKLWKCYKNGEFAKQPIHDYDHDNEVNCLNFDSTGNLFVSGCKDGKIMVFDIRSNEIVNEFQTHSSEITDVSFLGTDSNKFASSSHDKTVKIFNTSLGETQSLNMNEKIFCLKSDGVSIFTGGTSGVLKLIDISTEKEKFSYTGFGSPISSIYLSSNGTSLISCTSKGDFFYYNK
jgi:factor associated with neutral sphingomyelinase activation